MSQRLRDRFKQAHDEKKALFIPYVTAGYPAREESVPILLALQAGGADVIEVGVPFTDPLADGATIQHANHVAVEEGVTLRDCFGFVKEARAQGLTVPVIFMGYYNPILAMGEERAAAEAAAAGGDGFIVVDLPPEEAAGFLKACKANDMTFVPLVAPTTSESRMDKLAAVADAFIYCVSVTGTTGKGNVDPTELPAFLARVRKHTDLPLAVGFGINTRQHVVAIGKIADAAIVGSSVIAAIDHASKGHEAEAANAFAREMSGAS